jgi:hypothetical protein
MKNLFQRILSILAISLVTNSFANTAEEVAPLLIGAETPSVLLANQKGEPTELDSVLAGKPNYRFRIPAKLLLAAAESGLDPK